MRKGSILLLIIAVMAIAIPQAVAADQYQIYVYDSSGNIAPNIYVEVFDGGSRIDSGYTDNSGMFPSWLETSIRYRIKASGNGQFGEREDYPPNGGRIEIHMHY